MRAQTWCVAILFAGCSDGSDTEVPGGGTALAVPEFGDAPIATKFGGQADGLDVPRDLGFHPDRPEELWVANRADDSMVIFFEPGTGTQTAEKRIDSFAFHFMEEVSSFAWGEPDTTVDDRPISTFGTCQESRNTYNDTSPPNDFMGPALWPGDLDLFAEVNQGSATLGSHIDMLHQSPLCMGMAHEKKNQYWVFDGSNERLYWYDFQVPHGYGEDDHSDGKVRKYEDVPLSRVADVPGHIAMDGDTGALFVADTGTGRVLWVDPNPASAVDDISNFFEPLDEYSEYQGAIVEERVTGLDQPSGVLEVDGRLFVSDHGTGDIIAYDAATGEELSRLNVGPGVMGLEVGPDGMIWYVNADKNELGKITPE